MCIQVIENKIFTLSDVELVKEQDEMWSHSRHQICLSLDRIQWPNNRQILLSIIFSYRYCTNIYDTVLDSISTILLDATSLPNFVKMICVNEKID